MEVTTLLPTVELEIPGRMKAVNDFKFRGTAYSKAALYSGSFFDYFQFIQSGKKPRGYGLVSKKFREMLFDDSKSAFCGGSYQDLIKPHQDFSLYEASLKKLSSDKVWRQVAKSFDEQNVKRRSRSEYDGEFDFDKKWDTQPFLRREKKPQKVRILKLFVDAGFSASVSAEKINEFGAFVASLISMLEKNGIQVELFFCKTGVNFTSESSSRIYRAELKVKRADEYLPVSQILKVFSAVWYRRAMFSLIVAAADILGESPDEGLGIPFEFGSPWEVIEDRLCIYSVPSHADQTNIVERLTKLIQDGVKPEEKKL